VLVVLGEGVLMLGVLVGRALVGRALGEGREVAVVTAAVVRCCTGPWEAAVAGRCVRWLCCACAADELEVRDVVGLATTRVLVREDVGEPEAVVVTRMTRCGAMR
jgi:hypothetical protein